MEGLLPVITYASSTLLEFFLFNTGRVGLRWRPKGRRPARKAKLQCPTTWKVQEQFRDISLRFRVQNLLLGRGDLDRLFQPSRFMIIYNQHYFPIYFSTAVSYFSTRPPRSYRKELKQALNTVILPRYISKCRDVFSLRTSSKCSLASSHQQGFY